MSSDRLRSNSIGSTGHFRRAHDQGIARDADLKAMPAQPAWPVGLSRVLKAAPRAVPRLPAYLGVGLVYLYRYTVGVLVPGGCKYHPSCSQYAIDALRRYGLFRGVVLAGWRLLRCNPWSRGGVDYVEQQGVFR